MALAQTNHVSSAKHSASSVPAAASSLLMVSSVTANSAARNEPSIEKLCECWVIDTFGEIGAFARELERAGFRDIVVEQIQARVTPSVLHVPFVTLKFLLTDVLFGPRKMTRARWNNVLAPLLLPFVGYPIGPVAYYIVSATRI